MLPPAETLLSRTMKILRQTPKPMVALGVGIGFVVALFDTAQVVWPSVSKFTYLAGSCWLFIAWTVAEYAITMEMVGRRRSIAGLAKFIGANLARFAFLLLALLQLMIFPNTFRVGYLSAIVLVLILGGALFVVMLPAWSIEQSLSSKWISPLRALRATKGHRIQLLIVATITKSADQFIPKLTAIHDPLQVALTVVENALVYSFSNLLTAAMAAAAFFFAIRNDSSLSGEDSSDGPFDQPSALNPVAPNASPWT